MEVVNQDAAVDEANVYLAAADRLARRMHQSSERPQKKENIFKVPHKTKKQRWHCFSLEDKVNLVHDVVVGKMKLVDVAEKYCRTSGHVSNFIKKIKSKPNLLREMIAKHEEKR